MAASPPAVSTSRITEPPWTLPRRLASGSSISWIELAPPTRTGVAAPDPLPGRVRHAAPPMAFRICRAMTTRWIWFVPS